MKSEIDELDENLIKQLESYAKKFKSEQKKNVNLEHYNTLVESSRKQLIEYKKCLSLLSVENEEREKQSKESEENYHILREKIAEIKNMLLANSSITYEPITISKKDLLGRLVVKVCCKK